MKKLLIILALFPLLFFGCKKGGSTDEPKPEDELYSVNFSTNKFDESITPMTFKATTGKVNAIASSTQNFDLFDQLFFAVYKDNKLLITGQKKYSWSNISENGIKLRLPKGSYKFAIVGAYDIVNWNATDILKSTCNESTAINQIFASDILTFDVKSDSTYSPLKLNRISSSIELNSTDEMPTEVGSISIKGKNVVSDLFLFNKTLVSPRVEKSMLFNMAKSSSGPGQTIKTIAYPDRSKISTEISLEIFFYNKDRVLLGSKVIPKITIKENHKTILTGKLFDVLSKEGEGTFNSEVKEEYSKEVITQNF